MTIAEQINEDIKLAMKAKAKEELDALRAVKSAFLLAATEKSAGSQVSDEQALQILTKLVKQRNESSALFKAQNRNDLAEVEDKQAAIIAKYLPKQLSEAEIREAVKAQINAVGATGPQDMGKVMGPLSKSLAGKADGKIISAIVKELLAK